MEEINCMHCSWPIPDDHKSSHERENALPLEVHGIRGHKYFDYFVDTQRPGSQITGEIG
jgi:hypothetical protein